jgi:hypothetical protein
MTARSRVRRKPLPPTPTIDKASGMSYETLSTESFDDMCKRLGIWWPDADDYWPEVFTSPADLFSAITGFGADMWQGFIAHTEWQEQQELAGPEVTQAITATVVPSRDRYAPLAELAPSDTVIFGEVVD